MSCLRILQKPKTFRCDQTAKWYISACQPSMRFLSASARFQRFRIVTIRGVNIWAQVISRLILPMNDCSKYATQSSKSWSALKVSASLICRASKASITLCGGTNATETNRWTYFEILVQLHNILSSHWYPIVSVAFAMTCVPGQTNRWVHL